MALLHWVGKSGALVVPGRLVRMTDGRQGPGVMRGEGVRRGGHQPACSLLCLSEMSTGSFSRKARVSLSNSYGSSVSPLPSLSRSQDCLRCIYVSCALKARQRRRSGAERPQMRQGGAGLGGFLKGAAWWLQGLA